MPSTYYEELESFKLLVRGFLLSAAQSVLNEPDDEQDSPDAGEANAIHLELALDQFVFDRILAFVCRNSRVTVGEVVHRQHGAHP